MRVLFVAIKFYDLLIKLNLKIGYFKKGDIFLTFGKTEEAFLLFKETINFDCDYHEYLKRGDQYFDEKQYEIAFQFYDLLAEINPNIGYVIKGDKLIMLQRVKEAFEIFNQAIKYNNNHDEYNRRGDKFLQECNYEIAIQFYDLLIELNVAIGLFKKGDILISLGKIEEAFQMFDQAIMYNPDHNQYIIRGDKYFYKGNYDLAFKFYDLLIKLNLKIGYFKKGDIYLALQRIEEVFLLFKQTINFEPYYHEYLERGFHDQIFIR